MYPRDLLDQNRDWCRCPGVTQAGIPFLVFPPGLKTGRCALAQHIDPSVFALIDQQLIHHIVLSAFCEHTQHKIAHHAAGKSLLFHKRQYFLFVRFWQ